MQLRAVICAIRIIASASSSSFTTLRQGWKKGSGYLKFAEVMTHLETIARDMGSADALAPQMIPPIVLDPEHATVFVNERDHHLNGGRAPPSRNKPRPCAVSRWPAEALGSPANSRRRPSKLLNGIATSGRGYVQRYAGSSNSRGQASSFIAS